MAEDRFWRDTSDASASLHYAEAHYFPMHTNMRNHSGDPQLPLFGPSTIMDTAYWSKVLRKPDAPLLKSMLGNEEITQIQASGSFAWIYEDNIKSLINYYQKVNDPRKVKCGDAFPRFL